MAFLEMWRRALC